MIGPDRGHAVTIEGRPVVYLSPAAPFAPGPGDVLGFDRFDDAALVSHPRARRVLTPLARPEPVLYGVLHWSNGDDLRLLDADVEAGSAGPGHFDDAVFAELRTVVCRSCSAEHRVCVVDGGHPLATTRRIATHTFLDTCPACGARLGMLVVEFLPGGVG